MNKIAPFLWISDIDSVRGESLPEEIDHVVSVCQDHCDQNISEELALVNFPMADDEYKSTLYGGRTGYATFEAAVDHVRNRISYKESVLVHCHAGQNRSAAVCIAALATMLYGNEDTWSKAYFSALNDVKEARPIINMVDHQRRNAQRYVMENHASD